MKLKVTMKTPEALDYAINDALEGNPLTEDREDIADDAREKLTHWFKYGEYLTVEFDTDAMTASVLPAR